MSTLGPTDRSVRQILHYSHKFQPFKIAKVQELLHWDQEIDWRAVEKYWIQLAGAFLLTCDKVHFHLCGPVNKQNMWYWAPEKPPKIHLSPLHDFKQQIDEKGLDEVWFQQDSATAHTAAQTIALVCELFQALVISCGEDINWPPNWPYCFFFVCRNTWRLMSTNIPS